MNQNVRAPEETLSPGSYTNVKYWTVKSSGGKLVISPGSIPWKMIFFLELFICGLSAAILFFFVKMQRAHHETFDLTLLVLMSTISGLVALGCFFLPVLQVRNEKIKGDILTYDSNKEVLNLPRERLMLKKSQVVEFRILEECSVGRRSGGEFNFKTANPAELRLIFKNPNEKSITLLRTAGISFQDVINGLKQNHLSKVVLHQQKSKTDGWEIREI
jgi:hypothetical protein